MLHAPCIARRWPHEALSHQTSRTSYPTTTLNPAPSSFPFLPQDTIREFFAECGPIAEVRIAYDRDTGRAKGFAHVQFEELEGAAKATALSGESLMDRELYIESTTERQQREWGPGPVGLWAALRCAGLAWAGVAARCGCRPGWRLAGGRGGEGARWRGGWFGRCGGAGNREVPSLASLWVGVENK